MENHIISKYECYMLIYKIKLESKNQILSYMKRERDFGNVSDCWSCLWMNLTDRSTFSDVCMSFFLTASCPSSNKNGKENVKKVGSVQARYILWKSFTLRSSSQFISTIDLQFFARISWSLFTYIEIFIAFYLLGHEITNARVDVTLCLP